jgi:glycosyltransferase involved in cell wall biosynthesis
MVAPAKTIFCLPNGMELGGVTVWARAAAANVEGGALLAHEPEGRLRQMPWWAGASDVRRFAERYARELPAVFYPNWSHGTYAACAEISRTIADRIRVVGFAHADDSHYYDLLRYYEPMIHRFVAPARQVADRLARLMPERARDVEIVDYPVEVPSRRDRRYAKLGETLRLGYSGRLEERQKRVSRLADLAECLRESAVDFDLTVMGDGPERRTLEKRLRRLGVAARFTGELSHEAVLARYWDIDCLVLVSAFEGQSIALVEAMAAGCVPAVLETSGTRELIEPGVSGLIAPSGSVRELAGAIASLDPGKLPLLGDAARERAAARLSPSNHWKRIEKISEEAFMESPRPWPRGRPVLPPWESRRRDSLKRAIRLVPLAKKTWRHARPLFSPRPH